LLVYGWRMLLFRPQQQQELQITGGAHVVQNRALLYSGSTPGMFSNKETGGTTLNNKIQLNRSQGTPAELIVVVVFTLNILPTNQERETPGRLENDTDLTQMKQEDKSSHTGPP